MEKILVINGSPQRAKSGTLKVTNAFLNGVKKTKDCNIEILHLSDYNIKPCLGCLSCWGRTAGECVIKNDDVGIIKKKIMEADVVIESFPLYFFGMPGPMKTLTDRLLGLLTAYQGERPPEGGRPYHEFRYNMPDKKFLIISTCGYCQVVSIYDALLAQLDCIYGKANYQALLCPQGKVFSSPGLESRCEVYLEKYTIAGVEFAENGYLSEDTLKYLQEPIFTERRFQLVLQKFWHDEIEAGKTQRNNTNV